ncbi:hypothetical protein KUCAC02_018366 [Chaenocephalus aceratus]|uniref:Uncharacterized protein n=1 Tax=Chaenocephalus aceratus TaxID=36190 RepID=A0ACB9W8B3_CHAAC|nr:hypothetical protein KUCAC02_018366 [Chaenocephalus aceratus]
MTAHAASGWNLGKRTWPSSPVWLLASMVRTTLTPLAWDDFAWQPPSSLPHTFPLAIGNYHTVRVLACPKATAAWWAGIVTMDMSGAQAPQKHLACWLDLDVFQILSASVSTFIPRLNKAIQ